MSAKYLITAVLLGVFLTGTAQAQPPAPPGAGSFGVVLQPGPNAPGPLQNANPPPTSNGFTPLPGTAASNWVNGVGTLPVGRDGPIGEEYYWFTGPTLPIGGNLSGKLHSGWMSEVGGRALMFNTENTAAWTAGAGIAFQYNRGIGDNTFDYFTLPVAVRDLFRWSATWALGRDWFIQGAAPFGGGQNSLRFGLDVGGRWGTEHVNLHEQNVQNDPFHVMAFLRHHDIFGTLVFGGHIGFEIPMNSWVFFGGLRAEWDYNWSDVLQTQNSNLQDVNILWSFGFRY